MAKNLGWFQFSLGISSRKISSSQSYISKLPNTVSLHDSNQGRLELEQNGLIDPVLHKQRLMDRLNLIKSGERDLH